MTQNKFLKNDTDCTFTESIFCPDFFVFLQAWIRQENFYKRGWKNATSLSYGAIMYFLRSATLYLQVRDVLAINLTLLYAPPPAYIPVQRLTGCLMINLRRSLPNELSLRFRQ
jgi:hypothetical protein